MYMGKWIAKICGPNTIAKVRSTNGDLRKTKLGKAPHLTHLIAQYGTRSTIKLFPFYYALLFTRKNIKRRKKTKGSLHKIWRVSPLTFGVIVVL